MPNLEQKYEKWRGAVNGKRIWRSGSGFTVVLIHGVAMDLTMWTEIEPILSQKFEVICYDTIGHGPGIHPAGPYTIDQYAEQLDEILDELKVNSCIVVGFSMGGLIAEQFALSHPAKARGLVILNSVFDRTVAERAAVMERVVAADTATEFVGISAGLERWFTPHFLESNPVVVRRIIEQMSANDLKAFAAAYRVFATADGAILPHLKKLICPALIVTGEHDQRSTASMALRLASQLPNATATIIPNQRHLTPVEVPDLVAELITGFAEKVSR